MTKASVRLPQTTGYPFPKVQKATKLNNISFRHICDKNHIFKSLRMMDKDKNQDRGSGAPEKGTGTHRLISVTGDVPGFASGSVLTRAH